MSKRIGILGSGSVGLTLANGLSDLGYEVVLGNRTGHEVDGWNGKVEEYSKAADFADVLILAVKGSVAEELVTSLAGSLAGKTVIDTTNPIANAAPEDGVLKFFTTLDESLMERLQKAAPDAYFVKAFNSTGSPTMVKPTYKVGKPTMFICGNDVQAKKKTSELLAELGWEAQDFGGVKSARAIEPLCMLWCIPSFLHGERSHAFKLLK